MAHARCSASAGYRWRECSASVDEAAKYPETTSAYASEGTEAHEIAATCLRRGTLSGNPAIDIYVEYVRSLGIFGVEVDLTPRLSKLHPDLGGTADAVAVGGDWLEVVDLKYGQGVVVQAEENLQLKIYALGALLATPGYPKKIRATIFQPRAEHEDGPLRTWEFDAIELLEFAAELVEWAEATRTNKQFKSGSHCRFCPAAANCPELDKKKRELMVIELEEMAVQPAMVAEALDMLPALEAKIKAVRELAYTLAIQGSPLPGYKLVEKRAVRKWKTDGSLPAHMDEAWYTEPELRSPAQVEALIGRAAFKDYAGLVEKKSSGFTLVHDSDARAPASGTMLIEEFPDADAGDATPESLSDLFK